MDLVVDTSVLIDNFRGGNVWADMMSGIEDLDGQIYLPSIVQFEIMAGQSTRDEKVLRDIQNSFDKMEKVDLTESIARRAGFLYRDLGQKVGVVDYIVAATALELNAYVITLNKKHFSQISGLLIYPL